FICIARPRSGHRTRCLRTREHASNFLSTFREMGPVFKMDRKCPEGASCKRLKGMAGTTRLELATSAVTGQRSNQLNYVPTRQINDMQNRQCLCGFARSA